MKITRYRLRDGSGSEPLRRMLAAGGTFAALSVSSALFFILIGLALMARGSLADSPAASMKGFAASVSDALFTDMLGMEMAAFKGNEGLRAISAPQTAAFLIRVLTDINPGDPRSLMAGEMAGLRQDDAFLLRKGIADADTGPADVQPLPDQPGAQAIEGGGLDSITGIDGMDEAAGGGDTASGPGSSAGANENTTPAADTGDGTDGTAGQQDGSDAPATPTTGGRNVVFIYHSHNRESWKPELGGESADPTSGKINVTLVGKRLAQQLEKRGIGALHSATDYPTKVNNYRWEFSYKYSLETVKEAMTANRDLTFFFDIHRDSQGRKLTTATIDGKAYAQVYFIVGHRNPDWRKNEAFATEIHEAMEKKLPGISRGVWGKSAANGNGEYNQHLSPDSVLIEIGGVDNTLQECYRTADALAGVIADLYWNAEKVSAAKTQ